MQIYIKTCVFVDDVIFLPSRRKTGKFQWIFVAGKFKLGFVLSYQDELSSSEISDRKYSRLTPSVAGNLESFFLLFSGSFFLLKIFVGVVTKVTQLIQETNVEFGLLYPLKIEVKIGNLGTKKFMLCARSF